MITIPTPERPGPRPGAGETADRSSPVLFVSDFRYLDRPFSDIAPVVLDGTGAWLRTLAARHGPPAQQPAFPGPGTGSSVPSAFVRVGIGPERARIPVLVSLGPPRSRTGEVVVPLAWEPLQLERLLPSLDGDLTVSAAGDGACRLGLSGRYRAPFAAIGHHLDRFALHGLAESSVRNFLAEAEEVLSGGWDEVGGGRQWGRGSDVTR